MDIYSTITAYRCFICDLLLTICQQFVNGLEINVKNNAIFLKLMKFVNIVVAKYLLFGQYSEDI